MENDETKKEDAVTPEVTADESAKNSGTPAKEEKCRCSGDARTFFISLLTAIIVVLVYHGIVSLVRCVNGENRCAAQPQCMMNQQPGMMPPRGMHPGKKMHRGHHGKENGENKEFRRPRRRKDQGKPEVAAEIQKTEKPAAAPKAE